MSLRPLQQQVARHALRAETQKQRIGQHWQQLRGSWHALWTPGRILATGFASGFVLGRVRFMAILGRGGLVQVTSSLSALVLRTLATLQEARLSLAAATAVEAATDEPAPPPPQ